MDLREIKNTKSETVADIIESITSKMIKQKGFVNNFKFLVTDGAPACQKLGKRLKEKFPKIKYFISRAQFAQSGKIYT